MEKWESLRSKSRDAMLTDSDAANLAFAAEVIALAKNRVAVWENEAEKIEGEEKWTERTASHYPHIRLHGGALEDDVPPLSGLTPS
ncbi:MAG: hypothetical protein IAF08_14520 [Rhizobacter sp.]|nr:hypothetical protein [Chlorobiales bacterium]